MVSPGVDGLGAACAWSSATRRATFSSFAQLLRKMRAISNAGAATGPGEEDPVIALSSAWFEHVPAHTIVRGLLAETTKELVSALNCCVTVHTMVFLRVSTHETFEQLVCSGDPIWNGTTLIDVKSAQAQLEHCIQSMQHPFQRKCFSETCPAFFDENEVITRALVDRIICAVEDQLVKLVLA
jgi:hypothetical protein